jgi:hypothetical protein
LLCKYDLGERVVKERDELNAELTENEQLRSALNAFSALIKDQHKVLKGE